MGVSDQRPRAMPTVLRAWACLYPLKPCSVLGLVVQVIPDGLALAWSSDRLGAVRDLGLEGALLHLGLGSHGVAQLRLHASLVRILVQPRKHRISAGGRGGTRRVSLALRHRGLERAPVVVGGSVCVCACVCVGRMLVACLVCHHAELGLRAVAHERGTYSSSSCAAFSCANRFCSSALRARSAYSLCQISVRSLCGLCACVCACCAVSARGACTRNSATTRYYAGLVVALRTALLERETLGWKVRPSCSRAALRAA